MFIDWSTISNYSLRNCDGKLAVPLPRTQLTIVVQCCGTAYLPICGKHKLLLVLNTAVGGYFLIMIKLLDHTAFMESRCFVFVYIFVVIRFN